MRVSDLMSKNVVVVPAGRSASDALAEMRRRRIHHLVVVDAGSAVGVVSDRDLDGTERPVREVMSDAVVTARPTTTVKEAANLMRGHTIGCLPVFAGKRLVGIVTVTDLLDMIGRGVERSVVESKRWTLRRRAPDRRRARVA